MSKAYGMQMYWLDTGSGCGAVTYFDNGNLNKALTAPYFRKFISEDEGAFAIDVLARRWRVVRIMEDGEVQHVGRGQG